MLSVPEKERFEGFEKRLRWLTRGVVLVTVVVILRLAYLQVARGDLYAEEATSNRLRSYRLKSQRGNIYGRDKNTVLAGNRAACDLFIVPVECEGIEEQVCELLEMLVGVEADSIRAKLERHRSAPFTQIPVKRDIARGELARVEEMAYALPGVFTVVRPQRRYLYGETAGQILGYIGELSPDELDRDKASGAPRYRMGDVIGRLGLEEAHEATLKGRDGHMVVSVHNLSELQLRTDEFGKLLMSEVWDQKGRTVTVEYEVKPIPGHSVSITLDMDLQAKAEEILASAEVLGNVHAPEGAIVVLNADTGEILALASVPGYDPNLFVSAEGNVGDGDDLTPRERLLSNADGLKRMRHRAFQEHQPPGSVFKLLVAIAALEEGVIDRDTTFFCPGYFRLGGTRWSCWKPGGHGHVATVDAIAYSCDVFFYNVGLAVGVDKIKEWGSRLGLGEWTGIDLPREEAGVLPWPEWKEAHSKAESPYDRRWQKGDTVNLAIGQGDCRLTPLQTAVLMAAIVNGGRRVRPYIDAEHEPEVSEPLFSPETLAIVREGMRKCVTKHDYPSGTGRRADIEGMHVLGKTGTSQTVPASWYKDMEEIEIPYHWRDHAWFVAGVLDREPRIAVSVLFERGLHGSSGASPLAREVIEYFYENRAEHILKVARREETP